MALKANNSHLLFCPHTLNTHLSTELLISVLLAPKSPIVSGGKTEEEGEKGGGGISWGCKLFPATYL